MINNVLMNSLWTPADSSLGLCEWGLNGSHFPMAFQTELFMMKTLTPEIDASEYSKWIITYSLFFMYKHRL